MKEVPQAVQAAKLIKKELASKFKGVKFSVRTEFFSMGNSVNISWNTDKPIRKEVDSICEKYRAGHFDGMTDSFEYSNKNDLPKAMFISLRNY